MIIKNAILHILDYKSDICVFSQQLLDCSNTATSEYIEKHLEKLHKDSSCKNGEFLQESQFANFLGQYKNQAITFIDFSNWIGDILHQKISLADKQESTDLLIVDYIYEDISYFAVMVLVNKSAYTHQVYSDENGVYNDIALHYAILPSTSQRADSFAVINTNDMTILFVDKSRIIDGKRAYVLQQDLLECTSNVSTKEAVKIVKEITTQVAEEYGTNTAVAISRAKSYIMENSEVADSFSTTQLAEAVFSDAPFMKEAFEQKAEEKKIPKDIKIERQVAVKTSSSHKITTDTGIEITIPVEYFENEKYIEFINNPNGTISIQLKNIGKITNK